jgi:hypothetical protein
MRPTYTHIITRARQVILALLFSVSLSAENLSADSVMLDAYRKEDMSVWQKYVDTVHRSLSTLHYEYGFCGYIVDKDKEAAKPYVARFRQHVEALQDQMPAGHYEMYMSAVYVYELRLHESFRPAKAMSLAKQATKLAPEDPLVLSYYGTSLFYAPAPFGSKREALSYFEKADRYFRAPQYRFCWQRDATRMYIDQCKAKLK